jgi:hypothetical protein
VRKLLKVDAVVSVFLGREFVSINKREDANWAVRGGVVRRAARAQWQAGFCWSGRGFGCGELKRTRK